jgi:hypothetical protein
MPPRAPSKGAPQKRGFWSKGLQYALIGAFLLAPLLALLVQLSRAPNEEPAPAATVKPRALAPFIAGLLANPRASEFECSLDEINVHLSQLLPPARKSATGASFVRLTLRLESGACKVLATYLWRGREWQVHLGYDVQLQGGRLQLHPNSASVGRVRLGPYWTKHLQAPLLKLLPLLRKETVLCNRLEHLRLEPARAVLKVRASAPSLSP